MGTKRVGMARVKSLINENNNDLKMRKHTVVTAITADTTLTAADHYGAVILIDASAASTNFELTLPTNPAIGDSLEFLLVANSHSASEVLLDSGVNHTINGYALKFTASAIATSFHSHRKVGFGDSTKKGAHLKLVCTSAKHWMIQDSRSDTTYINAFS